MEQILPLDRLAGYGLSPEQVQAFAAFVQTAPPPLLQHANPRDWAAAMNLSEEDTLALLVAAAAEGLVQLHWEVDCPACGFHLQETPSLGLVMSEIACPACGGHGHSALDVNVFVQASLSEPVRAPRGAVSAASQRPPLPAIQLINAPGFRSLLVRQVLPEGQTLGVQDLTIFFSDLRDSTALYHRHGDARAYHFVREHFRLIFAAARQHHGNAIKTIGDGVMGIFHRPADALAAIQAIASGMRQLNQRLNLRGEDALRLKIGLHRGHCLVVTLNERLDYFGETVNIAARLNALAPADGVLISAQTLREAESRAAAAQLGALEAASVQLRGLPGEHAIWRASLSGQTED